MSHYSNGVFPQVGPTPRIPSVPRIGRMCGSHRRGGPAQFTFGSADVVDVICP